MEIKPPIIVSTLDLERIENLMNSQKHRNMAGIDELQKELDRATIVESADISPGVITMNSTVRFVDDESNEQFEMTLVYPDAAGTSDKVSIFAPIGSALLGLSVGQSITWQVPGGQKLLRVLEVVSQPEEKGQYHR